MKFEEVKGIVEKMVSNPDEAPTVAASFLEEIQKDYEGMASLLTEREQLQTRVKDLQDTNIKLFLSQVSPADTSDQKSDEDKANEVLAKLTQDNKEE